MTLSQSLSLDLGTTKFCLGHITEAEKLNIVSVPARGMHRGMLSNLEEARAGLADLLEIGENQLNLDISKVHVGIAGSHLASYFTFTEQTLDKNFVSLKDIEQLKNIVTQAHSKKNREIIDLIPVGFKVDNRVWTANPLGLNGRKIKGKFFIIESDRDYLKDVISLCNGVGLEIQNFFAEPFASSTAIGFEQLKELGVAILDIGGGTADGIIFMEGIPQKIFTINIGGMYMTSDLSVCLGISKEDANRIKMLWGIDSSLPHDTQIEISTATGNLKTITSCQVFEILESRALELSNHIYDHIFPFLAQIPSGLIITGGGSEVKGLVPYLNKRLKIPVQKSSPVFKNMDNEQLSAKYSTVVGLSQLQQKEEKDQANPISPFYEKYISPFIQWLRSGSNT